jgi:hypothetical protein
LMLAVGRTSCRRDVMCHRRFNAWLWDYLVSVEKECL